MKAARITALLMAILICAAMAAACAGGPPAELTSAEITTSGPDSGDLTTGKESDCDSNGYLLDALPELDFGGNEVRVLYDNKFIMPDFFVESENGEAVNDAIYNRNLSVEERLKIKLAFTGEAGSDGNQQKYVAAAMNDVKSGDNSFSVYGAYSRTIPLLSMQGGLMNLLDTKYFDVDKPWWPDALTDECTINGKLFFATGDISTNALWNMCAIYYNKKIWDDSTFGFTPEELVNGNTWTLDKFIEITQDFYSDDGNGTRDSADIYGVCAYDVMFDAFLNYSGVISVMKDESGRLALSEDYLGEKTVTLAAKLGDLCKHQGAHHSSTMANEHNLFFSGHSLFIIDGTYIIIDTAKGGSRIEFGYGLIPGPKFDANQEKYMTNMRYPYQMFAINSGCSDTDRASAVLEAQGSKGYRSVTPAIFEVTMKSRYAADNEVAKMYDILRAGICFDCGRIYNYSVSNFYPNFRNAVFAGGAGWAVQAKSISKSTPAKLEEVMAIYD
ncbi:MAG: hypothetical protein II534_03365 [Clostridia bacterium]|nr:hypothetical protein [Clostridia bacterium]